jgi:hypothetical protein
MGQGPCLLRRNRDGTPSVCGLAAKEATRYVPIVLLTGDPLGTGLVTSLARPGGNITGLSMMAADQVRSIPCPKSSKNSKANRIETGEKSGGIRRNLFGGSRRKIAKKIADHRPS